jgi:hypothetical protein
MSPDTVLVWRLRAGADAAALAALGRTQPALRLYRAVEGDAVYAYLRAPHPPAASPLPAPTRHVCTQRLAGAATDADAPWLYVVETDVLPEHEADFNAWYDQEHLAGLAAVPGTVSAARLLDPQGHPRYHACYELARSEAFNSPGWLAVRATAWSSRVRPAFRNTTRTMFRRWHAAAPSA